MKKSKSTGRDSFEPARIYPRVGSSHAAVDAAGTRRRKYGRMGDHIEAIRRALLTRDV